MTNRKILVVDDEESLRFTFKSFLIHAGYTVKTAENYAEALSSFEQQPFDVVVSDILLGDKTGIDLLREISARSPECQVIMVTGYPNVETASEAVRLGAFDYLAKPVKEENLTKAVRLALQQKQLAEEKEKYRLHIEAILQNVKEGILTVDQDLNITLANESAIKILGLEEMYIPGANLIHIDAGRLQKCCEMVEETLANQTSLEVQRHECTTAAGKKKSLTINSSPLRLPGSAFNGVLLVVRDETRLAALETRLHDRQQYHKIIGKSEKMQELYSMLDNLKDVQTTVLLSGETGTGKELIADALHYGSQHADKPFVKVNCAALPENLLESELFGHVKGAFTGAVTNKIGRFQKADGGTILLDEIGEISPRIQLRLLRVLQEKEFERVGDSETVKVETRVIAATNKDLYAKVRRHEFREDLFYRLNVVHLHVPPLRERVHDIHMLTLYFIEAFNKEFSKAIIDITDEVKDFFLSYSWPGNVRELKHTLEHAFVVCHEPYITVQHLPSQFMHSRRDNRNNPPGEDERERILAALQKTAGNKAKAARLLGVSRQTIYRKLDEFDLNEP